MPDIELTPVLSPLPSPERSQGLGERQHAVSRKTYVSDRALLRLVPHTLAALSVNAVTRP